MQVLADAVARTAAWLDDPSLDKVEEIIEPFTGRRAEERVASHEAVPRVPV